MFKVFFNYDGRVLSLNQKKKLRVFIESIFNKEQKEFSRLDYVFCSDEHLLQINRDFLQHDFYTDIITFNLSDTKNIITGEIYVSIDRVKDNALNINTSFGDEVLRVLFHGVLHLCGYNDKTKMELALMRQKEDYYINLYKKARRST